MQLSKQETLDLLMLLSALESWGFSTKTLFPDYLHEQLNKSVERLTEVFLEDE